MSGSGLPVVYHPIPRRPFIISPATPPEDDEKKDDSQDKQQQKESVDNANLLDPRPQHFAGASSTAVLDLDANSTPGGSDSISRAQSILNLTSSTLFGIFSPTVTSRGSIGGGTSGVFESSTPWGTGAGTPARDLFEEERDGEDNGTMASAAELDEVRKASQSLMMLQRKRRKGESFGVDGVSGIKLQPAPVGRGGKNGASSFASASSPSSVGLSQSRALVLLSVAGRAALLFTLGMGYGVLVSRLRTETHVSLDDIAVPTPPPADTSSAAAYDASYDWRYLVSWGLSGVVLGTLLPWFDGVWDRTFGRSGSVLGKARTAPETDWALVVRGIGAFAGVVFAMRKLPWASTMQASLTLALANPFLWYLLDRSKSGLLLAAAVGFVGSGVMMVLNLDLMPNPGMHHSPYHVGYAGLGSAFGGSSFHQNGSSRDAATSTTDGGNGNLDSSTPAVTAETAVWMLSVLFCSCVCFGNIGRRLALRPALAERGS